MGYGHTFESFDSTVAPLSQFDPHQSSRTRISAHDEVRTIEPASAIRVDHRTKSFHRPMVAVPHQHERNPSHFTDLGRYGEHVVGDVTSPPSSTDEG